MLIRTDTLQPWRGEPIAGILHPTNIEALWTVQELAAVGLVRMIPLVVPDGHRVTGDSTYAATGQETFTTEAIPQSEIDAARDASRDQLAGEFDRPESVLRAFMRVVLEEFNRHAAGQRAILAAAAAATSLADFKTRVGAINGIHDRTLGQMRDAVRQKLGT